MSLTAAAKLSISLNTFKMQIGPRIAKEILLDSRKPKRQITGAAIVLDNGPRLLIGLLTVTKLSRNVKIFNPSSSGARDTFSSRFDSHCRHQQLLGTARCLDGRWVPHGPGM